MLFLEVDEHAIENRIERRSRILSVCHQTRHNEDQHDLQRNIRYIIFFSNLMASLVARRCRRCRRSVLAKDASLFSLFLWSFQFCIGLLCSAAVVFILFTYFHSLLLTNRYRLYHYHKNRKWFYGRWKHRRSDYHASRGKDSSEYNLQSFSIPFKNDALSSVLKLGISRSLFFLWSRWRGNNNECGTRTSHENFRLESHRGRSSRNDWRDRSRWQWMY